MIQLINRPVRILRYTSFFAPRWGTFHHGIDAGAEQRGVIGDPLYATADGIVKRVRPLHPLMGNYIVMEHDRAWCDMDEHMNDFAVKAGQTVKAGDLIGHMGTTGQSTGAHLHYEIRNCPYSKFYETGVLGGFDGMPKYAIDPKPYLDAAGQAVPGKSDHAALVTAKAGLTSAEVAYINRYTYRNLVWECLWDAMKNYPKRSTGSYGKDYATAVARACDFEGQTVAYLWRCPNAAELWRRLWWQMT